MHRSISELVWIPPMVSFIARGATILAALVAIFAVTPVSAQEPTATPTPDASSEAGVDSVPAPPGDCWTGALSADPLHCYALEETQRDGHIAVEGLYEAGRVLYIFFRDFRLTGTRAELDDILKQNAREFTIQSPERVFYDFTIHRCSSGDHQDTYLDCMLSYTFDHGSFHPWSSDYDNIYLAPGGADARRSRPGWASWRQVWPGTVSGASDSFDVTGVDLTNFPEVECEFPHDSQGCAMSKLYPGFGIAGWNGDLNSKLYIQVKATPGEEANVEAALRAEFIRQYGPGGDGGDNTVIVPVKYDYAELWRWQLVLNRFALSQGNTIGITGAVVAPNWNPYEEAVFPLSGLVEATPDDYSEYRQTVHVWAIDAQRVVNALPTLLPLLGIPVDAVGVVGQYSTSPEPLVDPQPVSVVPDTNGQSRGQAEQSVSNLNSTSKVADSSRNETGSMGDVSQAPGAGIVPSQQSTADYSLPVWIVFGTVFGLVALALVLFWTIRSRRGRAEPTSIPSS